MKEQEKLHTTNYYDTFIAVAEDCPAVSGETPAMKGDKGARAHSVRAQL